jgi:hypothetical protein
MCAFVSWQGLDGLLIRWMLPHSSTGFGKAGRASHRAQVLMVFNKTV